MNQITIVGLGPGPVAQLTKELARIPPTHGWSSKASTWFASIACTLGHGTIEDLGPVLSRPLHQRQQIQTREELRLPILLHQILQLHRKLR